MSADTRPEFPEAKRRGLIPTNDATPGWTINPGATFEPAPAPVADTLTEIAALLRNIDASLTRQLEEARTTNVPGGVL